MRNRQHKGRGCRNKQTEPGTWGILLIVAGLIFLLHQIPFTHQLFPPWLFSWPMILIVVGLFSGIRTGFKGAGWIVVLSIGILFLIHQQSWFALNMRPYFWPVALIVLGLIIYFKRSPKKKLYEPSANPSESEARDTPPISPIEAQLHQEEEWLDVNAIFSHAEKQVNSKNFKGGQISATFGGADINLCHSDIQGTVTLNVSALFGGIEIILPSNWLVKNEVSVILGGLDDRRLPQSEAHIGNGKILIIKGSVVFGGVELKNY